MKKNRKTKELVPFEKSKRVIQVEGRGRKYGASLAHPIGAIGFGVFGVLSLLYCVGISFGGFGSLFFLMWGLIGVCSLALAFVLSRRNILDRIPKWVKIGFWSLFAVGLLLFSVVEGMICSQFQAVPQPGADYCIVLGAQWKSSGPSQVLRKRLEAALAYLEENPETIVIVSGGQGSNEVMSEAAGMQGWLLDAGISQDRIIMEDASTNTYENLTYSAAYLEEESQRVVIVTSNFHTFRALKIAQKQGYQNVEGLAADAVPGFLANNMLREFVGVVKDFVLGNL